jgi:hypothetical protein
MTVSSDEISRVAERIWANLFALPVTGAALGPPAIDEPVTGWVYFVGGAGGGLSGL